MQPPPSPDSSRRHFVQRPGSGLTPLIPQDPPSDAITPPGAGARQPQGTLALPAATAVAPRRQGAPGIRPGTGHPHSLPSQCRQLPDESGLPGHARARLWLYRSIDHLTFRGTLAQLLSSGLKLGLAAVVAPARPLRDLTLVSAGASAVQGLVGASLSQNTQHHFTWMSALAPHTALAPPPTVARWGLEASDEVQESLWRLTLVQGRADLQGADRLALASAEERLHAHLHRQRDWTDSFTGLMTLGVLMLDGLVASQASVDNRSDRLAPAAYQATLLVVLVSAFLDLAACAWQMRSRRPTVNGFPRPAPTAWLAEPTPSQATRPSTMTATERLGPPARPAPTSQRAVELAPRRLRAGDAEDPDDSDWLEDHLPEDGRLPDLQALTEADLRNPDLETAAPSGQTGPGPAGARTAAEPDSDRD